MVIDFCVTAPAWVAAFPFAFLLIVLLAVNRGWV